MKIYDVNLNKNEMTRPGEKRKELKKIVVCDAKIKNIDEMLKKINEIERQDEEYFSYNYVVSSLGKIYLLVPDNEISYFSKKIKVNLESISIGVLLENKGKKIYNENWKNSLIRLLNVLCQKYNLKSNDIVIEYDMYNTRNFDFLIDNYMIFEDIKKESLKNL